MRVWGDEEEDICLGWWKGQEKKECPAGFCVVNRGESTIDRHGFVRNDHMLFFLFEFEAVMGSSRYIGL